MGQLFQKSNDLIVLGWFFDHPSSEVHIRELARQLTMAASTLSRTAAPLVKEGYLQRRTERNAVFLKASLTPKFKALKTARTVSKLSDCGILELLEEKSTALSGIYLYGSAARGEDGPQSDYDILVIASRCWAAFSDLDDHLDREVNLQTFSISKWQVASKKNRAFYLEVISNCIPLLGDKPVID